MSTTLTDAQWERIETFLRAHPRVHVGNAARCRRFVEAVLWILRTGAQWRELPASAGRWNSVYKRFRSWGAHQVLDDMLVHFAQDADCEWICFDSSVIRAHMSAAGAPASAGGQQAQALGRSRGGFSTKIHVKVDALGQPLQLALTAGQRHDIIGYQALRSPDDARATAVLADMGYDADSIRDELKAIGVEAVIPSSKSRSKVIPHDKELYKQRHVVECFINKIKWFRRIATRYDKLAEAYLGFLTFASCLVWLR